MYLEILEIVYEWFSVTSFSHKGVQGEKKQKNGTFITDLFRRKVNFHDFMVIHRKKKLDNFFKLPNYKNKNDSLLNTDQYYPTLF